MKTINQYVGLAAMSAGLFLACAAPVRAITVLNNSFEDPPYPPDPGYGSIPSRTSSDATRSGVNPSSTATAPFLNGLPVPDQTHIAFIQNPAPTFVDRNISQ